MKTFATKGSRSHLRGKIMVRALYYYYQSRPLPFNLSGAYKQLCLRGDVLLTRCMEERAPAAKKKPRDEGQQMWVSNLGPTD